jgi:hypothetical protein
MAMLPTATTNPRFTTVLLLVGVTRQDRRIISASMVRGTRAVIGLDENVS